MRLERCELHTELFASLAPESILDSLSWLDATTQECPLTRKDTAIRRHATEQDLPLCVDCQGNDYDPGRGERNWLLSCLANHESILGRLTGMFGGILPRSVAISSPCSAGRTTTN